MAARTNRPRPGLSREDPAAAQEETSMWNQILADLRICKGLNDRATALSKEVVEVEASMGIGRLFFRGQFEICCYSARSHHLPPLYRKDKIGNLYPCTI